MYMGSSYLELVLLTCCDYLVDLDTWPSSFLFPFPMLLYGYCCCRNVGFGLRDDILGAYMHKSGLF